MDYLDKEEFMEWLMELSKIRLQEEECVKVKEEIHKTIGFFQIIEEACIQEETGLLLETSDSCSLRRDIVTNQKETDCGIQNAPQMKDGYYVVPTTVVPTTVVPTTVVPNTGVKE